VAEPVDVRRFVIQQHDATRLHWDLRLEHEGVLRSWALPRGIPWSPQENRLAVATEDHSLDFLEYEGDGADPGYGTGRMTNWDTGTFEAHKFEDDKVVVTLRGKRVSGRFALFSMRGGRDWLIHRMDPPADGQRVPVPLGVIPMRASQGEFPEDGRWSYEPAWNGLRATVTNDTGRVMILDAVADDVSTKFPEIRRIGRAIGHLEVILDGVIVAPSAAAMTRRMRITSDSGARNAGKSAPVVFWAFDVLWVEGRPITDQPWELRRRQLEDLRLDGPGWNTTPLLSIDDAFERLSDGGAIVAKRRESTYAVGTSPESRSPDWIEIGRSLSASHA
jgi:bifunctional non-homologous end joining protein LigD